MGWTDLYEGVGDGGWGDSNESLLFSALRLLVLMGVSWADVVALNGSEGEMMKGSSSGVFMSLQTLYWMALTVAQDRGVKLRGQLKLIRSARLLEFLWDGSGPR